MKLHLKTLDASAIAWPWLLRACSSERRFRVLRPALAQELATRDARLLPEAGQRDFIERASHPMRSRGGDALAAYFADLERLRPTSARDEFVLCRTIEVLRDALLLILGENPAADVRAVAHEHLSPYSPVLAAVPPARPDAPTTPCTEQERARLQQRLHELRTLQSALVDRNLHLVPSLARRYRNLGVSWEDLIQEGNSSLLRAVERYDVREGVRFARYAVWWIQQGILKALSHQSRTVRLPTYLNQALRKVREAQAGSPEPLSVAELSDQVKLFPGRVKRALAADAVCYSLERPPHAQAEDWSWSLAAAAPDPSDADRPSAPELRAALEEILLRLPQREALILRLRFGWEDGRARTLEEIRQELGVSAERVRQLQAQSLRRLSQPQARKLLERFA